MSKGRKDRPSRVAHEHLRPKRMNAEFFQTGRILKWLRQGAPQRTFDSPPPAEEAEVFKPRAPVTAEKEKAAHA
jgi:hypothetical protein